MSTPQDPSSKANRQEPASSLRNGGSKRRILIAVVVLAAIGGAVWLSCWWTVGRFIESTDDAYLQADNMTAAPKVAGYVTDVYVRDNQTVKAGDPLVRLDVRQYQVALAQSTATVDAPKGSIDANVVAALQGREVAAVAPNVNEVLRWNGSRWEPQALTDNVGITALNGDITASGTGLVSATIVDGKITTPKMFATPGANRLVATDSTTGAILTAQAPHAGLPLARGVTRPAASL